MKYKETEEQENPKITINLIKNERDVFSAFPNDVSVYDIMDVFVGMLVSAGYKQETIDNWIKTKAAGNYEYR